MSKMIYVSLVGTLSLFPSKGKQVVGSVQNAPLPLYSRLLGFYGQVSTKVVRFHVAEQSDISNSPMRFACHRICLWTTVAC